MPVRRFSLSLTAAALAGCGSIFPPPPREHAAADAAPVDAAPRDAGDAAAGDAGTDAGCALATVATESAADTVLNSSSPGLAFGGLDVANASAGLGSVAIFRFSFAPGTLPPSERVRAARVLLSYAATASDCAPSCGSCDGIDAEGDISLFFLRSDWTEAEATWSSRTAGTPWGAPGASGGEDRGAVAVRAHHLAHANETLAVDAARLPDLDAWRSGDEVSVLVSPSNGAAFVIATREFSEQECAAAGYAPPRMEVDFCP
jgi:hypothetical protein